MELPPTPFTELVGCRLPIQQAGMGSVSTVELAAAVAGEGGLGMLGATGLSPDDVVAQVEAVRSLAGPGAVVGANYLVPFLDLTSFEAAAGAARVVECFYDDPDPAVVGRGHDGGALVSWQVGSVDEAAAAVDAGCDLVVVQGREAGGHVRGTAPLLELLTAVRPRVAVPLVAAGGLGSGAVIAEAFDAGADAVRIGTRLLATPEADVHPAYASALVDATAADTVLTETFAMLWPHAPHRVLRACVDASGDAPEVRSPLPPTRGFAGDPASAAQYAGTSVEDVHRVDAASTVVRALVAEAAAARDRQR
jgi:NAD(P)H-dependent flavin oxidoreductase YrpB (nitropropane dioxygenase family)